MKRFSSLSLLLLLGLVFFQSISTTTIASTQPLNSIVLDQTVIEVVYSLNISGVETSENPGQKLSLVQLGDGQVSSVWDDVPKYAVPSFGDENGKIASIWGVNEIYFYIQHDADMGWVALQWDSDNTSDPEALVADSIRGMEKDDDLWIFGNARNSKISGDAFCVGEEGTESLETDILDDLYWERILVNDSEGNIMYTAWEISRILDTDDTGGHDIEFTTTTNTTLLMASDFNHQSANSNTIAKFSLSSEGLGGNFTDYKLPEPDEVNVGGFYTKQILIGVGIAALTFVLTFIPTQFILKKEAA